MKTYVCKKCNYKMQRNAKPDKCPYCDSPKNYIEEPKNAQDWLNDVEID